MSEEVWFAEPVTGHRQWTLEVESMTLQGAYGPWLGGFMEARCMSGQHRSPHDGCLCGINALRLDERIEVWAATPPGGWGHPPCSCEACANLDSELALPVVGIVDLGGRVDEYEQGYRAQYGRIAEATIITEIPLGSRFLSYLSEKYEAPFRALSYIDYREEWEATYGRDWEEETDYQDTEAPTPAVSRKGAITYPSTYTGSSSGTGWVSIGASEWRTPWYRKLNWAPPSSSSGRSP